MISVVLTRAQLVDLVAGQLEFDENYEVANALRGCISGLESRTHGELEVIVRERDLADVVGTLHAIFAGKLAR